MATLEATSEQPLEQPALRDVSRLIAAAKLRLDGIAGSTRKFGVIRLWPDQPVAEHENVARLKQAAQLIGAECIELDRLGVPANGQPLGERDVDFVLHLHFQTPKSYAPVSVAAMWNPLAFYVEWGFDRHWANQLSHDVFAYTGSGMVKSLIGARRPTAARDMPVLNHTLSTPIVEPRRRNRFNVFYTGINWERVGKPRGRHQGILEALDRQGRLELYGPEVVSGVKVWDGFKGYRGELPFDGTSVIEKAAAAGAVLVFSSDAHRTSNIMSNRMFEALAAGAVVIGDDHPFLGEALGSDFIGIDLSGPDEEVARQIVQALDRLGEDPEGSRQLARRAQDRLLDRYFLSTQVADLFEAAARTRERRKHAIGTSGTPVLDIVVQLRGRSREQVLEFATQLKRETGTSANLIVLCDPAMAEECGQGLAGVATVVALPPGKQLLWPAACFRVVRSQLRTKKVAFFLGVERLLGQNLLLAATELDRDSAFVRLGHVIHHTDRQGQKRADYFPVPGPSKGNDPAAIGSFIFNTDWLAAMSNVDLGIKGLQRIAGRQEKPTGLFDATALGIDLRAFEALATMGIAFPDWGIAETAIADGLSVLSRQQDGQETVFLSAAVVAQNAPMEDVSQAVSRVLADLPPETSVNILRGIYHALALPMWLRRLVRPLRRLFGRS